jgi:hypothetical protein
MLSGYKTYITGGVAIITSVAAYLTGTIDLVTMVGAIFAAIQTMNLRDALNSVLKK